MAKQKKDLLSEMPTKKTEPDIDTAALMAQLKAQQAQIDSLMAAKTAVADNKGKDRKYVPPGPWDQDCIGVLIKCEPSKARFYADQYWNQHFDVTEGKAVIRMDACGCSVGIKEGEWPIHNMRCPCGRHNHFAIKYEFEGF